MEKTDKLIHFLNEEQKRLRKRLLNTTEYDKRRFIEKLIDALERSKDDIRRSTSESNYRM